uniref:Uncharacterized protein n=1 Tax=Cacopsylla melanoneura TaxID=428564 RepID=A0A8D8M5L6_9HEMI
MVRFSKKIHPSTERLRPENHIQVGTDNTDDEDELPSSRSCCCPSLFSRCKCCNRCTDKCRQSKMYDRVCGKCCQSKCCKGITARLSSICSKLNVCKNIPNPCSKLQCCSKLKSCSSCCKRKSRDVDVEKGLQGAADVTGSKRLKNFWRFMCCLNTACCFKLRDKCGCCKKLSCCKMGGCCGPLTQEEEVERQKRARMKTKRMSQQISQVPKVR